jgi:fumarate reductase flavoprotein subunit
MNVEKGRKRKDQGQKLPELPPMGIRRKLRKDAVPDRTYGFEIPPAPIPSSAIKETINSDVVVVGGGLSGLSAAVSAAEEGAKVVLLEMMGAPTGHGKDNAAIGSRLQKKLGIEIDRDEVILNLMKYGVNKPDQQLIRMWAEGSGESMDWLLDMTDAEGLNIRIDHYPPPPAFNNADEYYPQYHVTHQFDNQSFVVKCLKNNASRKGVDIHFNTRARQLLRKGEGKVTGVIASNKNGDYIRFNAGKAVVLCTGDYGNNAEMMAKYCPQASYITLNLKTSTGDGHMMAMWVGAMMEPAPHAPMIHGVAGPLGVAPFMQVNIRGKRFHNEDVPTQSYVNAVERQPGQQSWQIFDSKYPDELSYMGIGLVKINKATDQTRKRVEKECYKADTIEGLAEKMGVPIEAFKSTVTRYNGLARIGKDLDFGKRPDRITTIDKPPYYAGKGRYFFLAVMGGIMVNTNLQALDKNWQAIPGLYMAGNTMGNRFAVDYPTMCPGICNGMALHFGRIAGKNCSRNFSY